MYEYGIGSPTFGLRGEMHALIFDELEYLEQRDASDMEPT